MQKALVVRVQVRLGGVGVWRQEVRWAEREGAGRLGVYRGTGRISIIPNGGSRVYLGRFPDGRRVEGGFVYTSL